MNYLNLQFTNSPFFASLQHPVQPSKNIYRTTRKPTPRTLASMEEGYSLIHHISLL